MSLDIFFADPDEAMRFVIKHTNPSIDYDPLYFTANPDEDCDTPSKPPKLMRPLSLSSANPSHEALVPLDSVRSFRLDITNEFTTMPDLTTGEAMSLPRENGTKDLMLFAARHTFASRVGDVLGRMTALECLRLCLPFSAHHDYYRLVPNILRCAPQSLRSLETDARYCRGRSDVFEGTNFQNLEGLVLEGVQDPENTRGTTRRTWKYG